MLNTKQSEFIQVHKKKKKKNKLLRLKIKFQMHNFFLKYVFKHVLKICKSNNNSNDKNK